MILTCPECATGYFVDDAQIKPGGRSVRCASCGARWIAKPDKPLDLVANAEEGAVAREAQDAETPLTGDDLPKAFRARANNDRKVREATLTGLVWGGMLVVVLLLVVAAIVWRKAIVQAIPSTAAAYKLIGLPVNRVGLTIEQVRAEPALQDGHAALVVSGVIRNVEDRAIVSPPLRIMLYNSDGKPVMSRTAPATDPRVPPGQKRFFNITLKDPPLSAHDLQVDFDLDAKDRPAAAAPVRTPLPAPVRAPALRGETAPEIPLAPTPPTPAGPAPATATPAGAPPPGPGPATAPALSAPPHPSPTPPPHATGPGPATSPPAPHG